MRRQSLSLLRQIALGFTALIPLAVAAAGGTSSPADNARKPSEARMLLRHADSGTFDTQNNVVSLEGHVEVDYKGRILIADRVSYDIDADVMTADGHISLMSSNGDVAFAEHVTLKDQMRDGLLAAFGAFLGQNGRLAAATANRSDQGRITEARKAVYSNCKICREDGMRTPLWQVRAARIVHNRDKKRITFDDATLEFFGEPVLYSPYLSLPDPSVHYASGLLTPAVGNSSTIGYFIRLPYYFAINESQDATLEPLFSTSGGSVLLGEYRQRWENSGLWLQGSAAQNPNGGVSQNQQQFYSHLFAGGSFALTDGWKPGDGWQAGFDTQISSKDTYLARYDISEADRLTSDLFLVGEHGRSRFAVTGYFFQSLRLKEDNRTIPVALPLIEYSYIPLEKWGGGQFSLNVNTLALSRDSGTNNQRLSADTRWRRPFVDDIGQLWTIQLDARGDIFHTDSSALVPGESKFAMRGMPTAALDWRWPFIARGNGARSVIIEPIAQMIAAPYGGNPKSINNEDSLDLQIDDNNIFSFDQVPGYDLVQSGPRANFGFRLENRFDGGYVEALLGQTLRLKSDPIFTDDTGEKGTASDLVGRFSIRFAPYLDLTQRISYDESTGKVRRDEVYLTGNYGRSSLQVNYVQLAKTADVPAREEINTQADINFYGNMQAFAAIRRDQISNQTLSSEFGLGYIDECFGISLAYRRKYTSDRDLRPSTAVLVHFNLRTTDEQPKPFSLFPHDIFSYTRS